MKNIKLNVYFLGVGNGTKNENGIFHSNIFVSSSKHANFLFVDCGCDFPHSLNKSGFDYKDVKNVYISHLHSDHFGGLEWLGFTTHFGGTEKPKLYVADTDIKNLEKVLKVSMSPSVDMRKLGLGAYFDVFVYHDRVPFLIGDIKYTPIKTLHIDEGYGKLYSHGLFIENKNSSALITSDTQFKPEIFMKYYKKADIIFHDCSTSIKNRAHAHISDLKTLPGEIKKKMVLYHCSYGKKPLLNGEFKEYARQNFNYAW